MKKFILFVSLLLTAITCFVSCKDIIEPSISKKNINLITPTNNHVSENFSILFWWEKLEDADQYNIQIVKPNFVAGQQLIVDSTISGNKFAQTLQPGDYQWRVKGINSIGSTEYTTYTLSIDSSLNLTSQVLLLDSPVDNYTDDSLLQNFSWLAMPNATEYVFKVLNNSGVPITNAISVDSTNYTYTFPMEGTFKWRVFALNSQSASAFSERTITVDTTAPSIPLITFLPVNDTTTIKPVSLAWNSVENNAVYQVLISTDSTFTGIYKDTLTRALTYKLYNPTLNQIYYWKLNANDQAGNASSFTNTKKFTVQ